MQTPRQEFCISFFCGGRLTKLSPKLKSGEACESENLVLYSMGRFERDSRVTRFQAKDCFVLVLVGDYK